MARQRVIVGIGEAVLCEYPDRVEPGGLAVLGPRHAVRMGHIGVTVSRIGQDDAADELMSHLRGLGVRLDALQSDPDLPTGRLIVRSIAGKTSKTLTAKAAFDNLQWDFDLVDVAQQADAVIFGSLARREGQSRSIIKRFLAECTGALRLFDLTNRAGDIVDRTEAVSGLEFAEALMIDSAAMKVLAPAHSVEQARAAALEIMRGTGLSFVAHVEPGDCTRRLTIHAPEQSWPAGPAYPSAQHEAAVVGLAHGILNGWDFVRSLEMAARVAEHAAAHPDERMPAD